MSGALNYYSYTVTLTGENKWTYVPIGATENYHFNVENDRVDPFY